VNVGHDIMAKDNRGWHNESERHSLAAKGIKTGTKTPQQMRSDAKRIVGTEFSPQGFTREYIEGQTGFTEGDRFKDEEEVRGFFTVDNMEEIWDDTMFTQEELDEMATLVIENQWHMEGEPEFDEYGEEIVHGDMDNYNFKKSGYLEDLDDRDDLGLVTDDYQVAKMNRELGLPEGYGYNAFLMKTEHGDQFEELYGIDEYPSIYSNIDRITMKPIDWDR